VACLIIWSVCRLPLTADAVRERIDSHEGLR
jgi:hypothetical protein